MMEMVHEKYSTLLTEFIGTALTTIFYLFCSSIVINAVIVTTVVFFGKKGDPYKISHTIFFIRIVNNDGYICVVTLEIVKKKIHATFF